jgi:gentisate 1,2-dioxygenase
MSNQVEAGNARLEALEKRLADNSMAGHWQTSRKRAPALEPAHWSWDTIYSTLYESGEVVHMGEAGDANNRRTVQLVNPALPDVKATSRTLQVSIQLVKPGETAGAHRHTFNAMRFVVESDGMYTNANGEQMIMEPGDLLVQPGWAWHDHVNNTNSSAIWLDLHDNPMTQYFDSMASEVYGEAHAQPITKADGYGRLQYGSVRPRGAAVEPKAVAYSYKWADTLRSLDAMAGDEGDPFDGVLLEYVNPLTGGGTLPTIGCWVQMLRPGEATRPHRHTASTVYHVLQGEGVTTIGKSDTKDFNWGERDCMFVPALHWHQHRNRSASEPAILFSVTDRPSVEALGFYREEAG